MFMQLASVFRTPEYKYKYVYIGDLCYLIKDNSFYRELFQKLHPNEKYDIVSDYEDLMDKSATRLFCGEIQGVELKVIGSSTRMGDICFSAKTTSLATKYVDNSIYLSIDAGNIYAVLLTEEAAQKLNFNKDELSSIGLVYENVSDVDFRIDFVKNKDDESKNVELVDLNNTFNNNENVLFRHTFVIRRNFFDYSRVKKIKEITKLEYSDKKIRDITEELINELLEKICLELNVQFIKFNSMNKAQLDDLIDKFFLKHYESVVFEVIS